MLEEKSKCLEDESKLLEEKNSYVENENRLLENNAICLEDKVTFPDPQLISLENNSVLQRASRRRPCLLESEALDVG